jgi:hypothetical protein
MVTSNHPLIFGTNNQPWAALGTTGTWTWLGAAYTGIASQCLQVDTAGTVAGSGSGCVSLGTNNIWTGTNSINAARTITSATGATLDDLNVQPSTTTLTGTTTVNQLNKVAIYRPTITDSSAVNVSAAASLYIDNSPLAAGSATISLPYSIWAKAGTVLFGASLPNFNNVGAINVNSGANGNVIVAGSSVSNTSISTYYTGPVFFYQLGNNTVGNTQAIDFRSDTASQNSYAAIGAQITDVTLNAVKGKIFLGVANGSGAATNFVYIEPSGGMNVGTDTDPGGGFINATSGFKANGTAGVSTTCTVTAGNSYVFTFGLLTTKGANCT